MQRHQALGNRTGLPRRKTKQRFTESVWSQLVEGPTRRASKPLGQQNLNQLPKASLLLSNCHLLATMINHQVKKGPLKSPSYFAEKWYLFLLILLFGEMCHLKSLVELFCLLILLWFLP